MFSCIFIMNYPSVGPCVIMGQFMATCVRHFFDAGGFLVSPPAFNPFFPPSLV